MFNGKRIKKLEREVECLKDALKGLTRHLGKFKRGDLVQYDYVYHFPFRGPTTVKGVSVVKEYYIDGAGGLKYILENGTEHKEEQLTKCKCR